MLVTDYQAVLFKSWFSVTVTFTIILFQNFQSQLQLPFQLLTTNWSSTWGASSNCFFLQQWLVHYMMKLVG